MQRTSDFFLSQCEDDEVLRAWLRSDSMTKVSFYLSSLDNVTHIHLDPFHDVGFLFTQ